MGSESAIEWT